MSSGDDRAGEMFDLLVVGGGINGAGVARDAAGRGLKVLLVERDDLAAHTSSASTKLIHGGLRYLEYYEFRLVRESLIERERLLAIAPHIIWPLRFVLPKPPTGRPGWLIRFGLFLYDHIGGRKRLPASERVSLRGPLGDGLKAAVTTGFAYSDCWVQDARLVVLNAMDARERGADIRTRTALIAARRAGDRWIATLRDEHGTRDIAARAIVNAAGQWVQRVLGEVAGTKAERAPRLVKGSHIVVPRLFAGEHAFLLQNPDKRIVFAIPYEGAFTLIGTTDVAVDAQDGPPAITPEETDYLCTSVNRYFATPIGPADVVWSYAGIRPLYDDGRDDASAVTREYVLKLGTDAAPQILSAFGGKITTYRKLAEHALAKLAPFLPMDEPWTDGPPLPGGDIPDGDVARFVGEVRRRWPFLAPDQAWRLVRAYGTRVAALLGDAASPAALGEDFGGGLHRVEIDYLVREEWARSADDILWRRSKLGLHVPADTAARIDAYLASGALRRAAMGDARHILAIDQGTTSTRSIVFDAEGRPIASAQAEFAQHYPRDGWVEHDPEDIWRDVQATMRGALAEAGLQANELAAIGITNQRETTLLWDRRTGEPLHRAIVWQDRRGQPLCARLRDAGHEPLVRARTGLLLDPYFSATKLAWLLDTVPGARERAEAGELAFGTVDTFLLWRLTEGGAHRTDATNASRTLLFDIHRQRWCPELLALFGIPAAILPEVCDSSAAFGETRLLGAPVPIGGIAGDQQAALFGQACFAPGEVKATYGTGCFLLLNTGEIAVESHHKLLTTVAYRLAGRTTYASEGAIFVAGAAIKWLRDGLGLITHASQTHDMATRVADNGGVYLVPAFVGLGAPHWDPEARGTISGLTLGTEAAHLARAALEAVAYQTADLTTAMVADGAAAPATLRVDGGMAANDWLCQFLADILRVPVERPETLETTARGAAFLAGLAVGLWADTAALAALPGAARRFVPTLADTARDAMIDGWRRALGRTLTE